MKCVVLSFPCACSRGATRHSRILVLLIYECVMSVPYSRLLPPSASGWANKTPQSLLELEVLAKVKRFRELYEGRAVTPANLARFAVDLWYVCIIHASTVYGYCQSRTTDGSVGRGVWARFMRVFMFDVLVLTVLE